MEYKPDLWRAYIGRALDLHGAGAQESNVSRTENTMKRTHGPVGIFAIEGFPICAGSSEPMPGIERQVRREDIVAAEGAQRNNVAVSTPPPPEPPTGERRPETPERVDEDRRNQWIKYQEDLTTNTHKGSGDMRKEIVKEKEKIEHIQMEEGRRRAWFMFPVMGNVGGEEKYNRGKFIQM